MDAPPNDRFLAPCRTVCRLAVLCAAVTLSSGQATDPEPSPGAVEDVAGQPADSTDEAERLAPRVPGEVTSFSPKPRSGTSPVRPGLTEGVDWELMTGGGGDRAGRLQPERTFVNRIRGEMIEGPRGTRIFVPTRGGEGGLTRPMLALPCGVLERFDEFVMRKSTRAPVLVSGRLFLYGNRNYLMPSSILAANAAPGERAEQTDDAASIDPVTADGAAAARSESAANAAPTDDADIEALIGELEDRPVYTRRRSGRDRGEQSTPREADRASGAPDVAPPVGLSTDEQYVSGMRGRVVRSAEGMWQFVADNDTESGDARALTMLPCRMLQSLEGHALREGDASAIVLSGRVYTYHGQRFILPTLFQRERRIGVDPLQ